MPILARVMDVSAGPVLELGMGIYSTPLLDIMCHETKRKLVSYDSDPKWYDQNKEWKSEYHTVNFIPNDDWDWCYLDHRYINTHWSVVFTDEKPAKNRIKSIKHFANKANFIVIHDSEPESDRFFKYSWIYPMFKYRYDYTKCRPNTTVLSNFVDLSFLEK
jgi:hypothetical protein